MMQIKRQVVALPGVFRIDHSSDGALEGDDDWIAIVRAPEGLTVIRLADSDERWVGFYGEDPHDLDAAGMLAVVLSPLSSEGISVFVASTFHSDLVLVPEESKPAAISALRAAGHRVREARSHESSLFGPS